MNKDLMCTNCVMDTSDPDLCFSQQGVCSICKDTLPLLANFKFSPREEAQNLNGLSIAIKRRSSGKYDSILGLSGGVDSSYVAFLAHKMNLNPLCVHFDNGWNSEIAVKNIRKIIDKTGFDLTTYVIDWPEFRDLQRAFFKAGVIDIEMLTDHAIFASLFKIRRQHRISTVLSGTNFATEHGMPNAWLWHKTDWRNIRAIHKRHGSRPLRTFPRMSTLHWLLMKEFNFGGHFEEPLNNVSYFKQSAMATLRDYFDWQYYGGKHYESVFTKFYQAYVLPEKFGVDKRKAHLSALIRNGELSRDDALQELAQPLYEPAELRRDTDFVLKKLGFEAEEFESLISAEPVPHREYPSDRWLVDPLIKIGKKLFR